MRESRAQLRQPSQEQQERLDRRGWRRLLFFHGILLAIVVPIIFVDAWGKQGTMAFSGKSIPPESWRGALLPTLLVVSYVLAQLSVGIIGWALPWNSGPRWCRIVARIAAITLLSAFVAPTITLDGRTPLSLGTYLWPLALALYLVLLIRWMSVRRVRATG